MHRRSAHRTRASAATSALRSEPECAAKSPVDVVHEGSRRMAHGFLKVSLIEGDEGGDVDDRVLGEAGNGRRQENVAGHSGQSRIRRDDGRDGSVQPAGVERVGLDDQDRASLSGLTTARFAEIGPADAAALGHHSSWPAR